ncbi:MAG: sulfatase [Planctomycetes bacterium]|nr:sulfatase [Planctomycetota bacterium]
MKPTHTVACVYLKPAWRAVFLQSALTVLLLAPLASFAAPERPNVLFICTDQQHAGMLSCAGNRWLKTPAMDSLAATGARFERAYSVNPVCVPSRTGMLTGYTPSRFGMQSNGELATTGIPDDIQRQTMGWLFRNAGYETAYGGKTHVPGKISDYGFDVLTADQRDGLAAACVAFLNKAHDKPFLLVASFINPHDICYMAINDFERAKTGKPNASGKAPHQVCLAAALERPAGVSEAEFFAKYCPPAPANLEPQADAPEAVQQSLGGKARTFRQHAFQNWSVEQWRLHRWAYCRLTERVDREIGLVLQALRAAGLEEKTLVVLTSDHGDMDGSHRLEHKSMFYEEAARVPFIVSFKGVTKPGLAENQHLVSSGLDLIPTLCDYAGITPPAALLGRSVRALAEGRAADDWRPYVASETHYGRMICSGRYKYCVYETGQRREQLVDLEKDPGEMKNLAADPAYADVLARHRQYLREWVESNHDKLATPYLIK